MVHGFSNILWWAQDQDGTQVGLPVISGPEPTGPMRLEVGESLTMGDLRLLRQEAHASVMSKAPHEASKAQDITSADVDLSLSLSLSLSLYIYIYIYIFFI